MSVQKCVVEGCNLEYDVVCSFSFYNVNTSSDSEALRQEWIEGAMQEESECLWRHVSLHLCGYHFELDTQGLWIDSPMLPDLLTLHEQAPTVVQSETDKMLADIIRTEHNYSVEPSKQTENEKISRLNVRQFVDTLGYLSLKNLQRKQLWVVKVESDKAEASITQAEQVITKMADPKHVIEIIPQEVSESQETNESEAGVIQVIEDSSIPENFIYEIAEEQEISMDEVKEIPVHENKEWMVNIIPEDSKPKYAYIKHCNTGKKKRHFTSDINEISLQGDFENYYILPDADPSVGVEITTSYEPESYIVQEYETMAIDDRPRKKNVMDPGRKKKKKLSSAVQIVKAEPDDWALDNTSYEESIEEYDPKTGTPRVRRKNKKYLGYDFVT